MKQEFKVMGAIHWVKIKNQSLALAVRAAGFDLTIYEQYSVATKNEIKKRAIKEALLSLRWAFEEEENKRLEEIKRGVYVICLSPPYTIQYSSGQSEIIYIGQGNVQNRLKQHFEVSLFSFMQSLAGTNFDFWICDPKRQGGGRANEYHKHIEHQLLERFSEKFGGNDRKFPLLNKNAGSCKNLENDKGWDKPLKGAGKRPKWVLQPTNYWDFKTLD